MGELVLIRHAQASFGAADYDVLSEVGHRQSHALGVALAAEGLAPDAWFVGGHLRHRETLEGVAKGMGAVPTPRRLDGLNEFDFKGLFAARFRDTGPPEGIEGDRRAYFRQMREAVLAWQRDEVTDPPEPWADFRRRVLDARDTMIEGGERVVAVTSGGPIALMVAVTLDAPAAQMVRLQLRTKNASVTRLAYSPRGVDLFSFNETPHIDAATAAEYLTFS